MLPSFVPSNSVMRIGNKEEGSDHDHLRRMPEVEDWITI